MAPPVAWLQLNLRSEQGAQEAKRENRRGFRPGNSARTHGQTHAPDPVSEKGAGSGYEIGLNASGSKPPSSSLKGDRVAQDHAGAYMALPSTPAKGRGESDMDERGKTKEGSVASSGLETRLGNGDCVTAKRGGMLKRTIRQGERVCTATPFSGQCRSSRQSEPLPDPIGPTLTLGKVQQHHFLDGELEAPLRSIVRRTLFHLFAQRAAA